MRKSKWVLVLIWLMAFLPAGAVRAEKVAVLSDILKVEGFSLDEDQLYLTQGTTVFIYSKKDFKLIKKFGKPGEGPREFLGYAHVFPQQDHLMINSQGKISLFTKEGTFIKELKTSGGMGAGHFFQPMKDGFVGRKMVVDDKVVYFGMFYFDDRLNEIKEIYRVKSVRQPGGKIHMYKQTPFHRTYRDKLFVSGKPGFHIDVIDADGKLLYTVKHDYKPPKFTAQDEKESRRQLKHRSGARYDSFKDRLSYPEYFPEIQFFLPVDEKLYVATWKRKGDALECVIFDNKGKLLKQVFVPCKFLDGLRLCPLEVSKGKLYQVVENENEELELHVVEI